MSTGQKMAALRGSQINSRNTAKTSSNHKGHYTMKDQIQTCGNSRYYDGHDRGDCHASPPTVTFDRDGCYAGSFHPDVARKRIACRFFEQKGGK